MVLKRPYMNPKHNSNQPYTWREQSRQNSVSNFGRIRSVCGHEIKYTEWRM